MFRIYGATVPRRIRKSRQYNTEGIAFSISGWKMQGISEILNAQFDALAAHFAGRRQAILKAWRDTVLRDPQQPTADSLPRTQFHDHIPQVLDIFERILRAGAGVIAADSDRKLKDDAAAHGLQRWQQGYDLREVTLEWGCLHFCLVDELEQYAADHSEVALEVMSAARRSLVKLCSEGVSESTSQYFQLQQIEATGHVRDLNQALDELRQLESQRAELWRQAAHDLRGNVGVVMNVTEIMRLKGIPEIQQNKIFGSLQKSVSSLHSMLNDVLILARLQAGQERLEVCSFDASKIVSGLCENLHSVASARDFYLKSEGPSSLLVEGDPGKVLRIAQNLILNALKYTTAGGVTVRWGDSRLNDRDRWMLSVQDTGPGFHAGPGALIVEALEEATEDSRHTDKEEAKDQTKIDPTQTTFRDPAKADIRPVHQERGEGIGLSIVKRLSELLQASVEVESVPGEGTTFRVVFPRRYG